MQEYAGGVLLQRINKMYTIRISKQERVKIIPDVQADEVHAIRMLYAKQGYRVQIFKSKSAPRMSMRRAQRIKGYRIA